MRRLCVWCLMISGWLCQPAVAWFAGTPAVPVPEHTAAWKEMRETDPRTVLLWKFSTQEDEAETLDAWLMDGDLLTLTESGPELDTGGRDASEPRLQGGATIQAGAGCFGGGLVLDGHGYAEGHARLASMLTSDGALTLDFWFRVDALPGAGHEAVLAALDGRRGQPLLTLVLTADAVAAVRGGGESIMSVPVRAVSGSWHHLALVWEQNGTLTLMVDDRLERVPASHAWVRDAHSRGRTLFLQPPNPVPPALAGLVRQVGSSLTVGGAEGQAGLRGAVDEVRLTRGVRYLYRWHLGWQQRPGAPMPPDPVSPYFRENRVITRFRFDGSLEPETFAGRSWTGTADDSHFRPGLRGRALDLSRINETAFSMTGFHVLPDREGTIEFWFRPLEWNNFFQGSYHGEGVQLYHLLRLMAKDSRYGTPTKNIEVFRGRAGNVAKAPWDRFHPGTWTHVLISLRDGRRTVYLNGQRQRLWQVGYVTQGHPHAQAPLKAWRERTGGEDVDDTWNWHFVPSPTLIDELTVYAQPMSEAEAWNAYARWVPEDEAAMRPLPRFDIRFSYVAHSWNMQERLRITAACLEVDGRQPTQLDLALRDADGEVLLAVEQQALEEGGVVTLTLDRALPFGRYPVTVRSRAADGTVLAEETLEYHRERPDWYANTLGKERTVPQPWTPVEVDGPRIGIIDRTIELGTGGLPARIETLGREVLAAPVVMRVDGTELRGQDLAFTETAPDRAAWTAALEGGGVTAQLEAWMEFDGLLYCSVTLRGTGVPPVSPHDTNTGETPVPREIQISRLSIDFPMTAAHASQLLANGGGNDFRAAWLATYTPAGEGRVWDSLKPTFGRAHGVTNFIPHIWLGDDDVGLYFGAENDQGWTVDGPVPAQEILREGAGEAQTVVLRMNIIREPTRIEAGGRRFHFVLLPTPAKPEPPDWRHQMLAGGVNFSQVDTFGGFDMKVDPIDPDPGDVFLLEPKSWEHAAAMSRTLRERHGPGRPCILYADMSWPRFGPSFRDWNHDLHAATGRLAIFPEMEDYMVWAIHEFLERGLIDGVYWDDVSVGYTYSLASTAYAYAGSPNGRRVGFTALAQRRINQRLWRLFEAADKEPMIWAHMTVCYEVPLFSFCRYLSNVEFTTGVDFPGKRDAMDMWSADVLRILGGSAKWGTGYHNLSTLPRGLPDSGAARQWLYPQARTETGLYLTSDQLGPADGLGQVLVEEGIFAGPVQAYPWWKADEVVTLTAPEGATVRAGVYVAEGRAVVIVANWDHEEREVAITLRPEALPWATPGVVWRDIDPGLVPPADVAAGAEELRDVQPTALLPEAGLALSEADLDTLIEGLTPAERALQRLEMRQEGDKALVMVRSRDYRVLEVRPRR